MALDCNCSTAARSCRSISSMHWARSRLSTAKLLDNPVFGVRRHFFDFVSFVQLVPQPAIDLGQMRENRADTARDFRDRVAFFPINLVGGKSQPPHRNATAGGIRDKRIDLLPEPLLLRCQAAASARVAAQSAVP
jgi:hypothetical protein